MSISSIWTFCFPRKKEFVDNESVDGSEIAVKEKVDSKDGINFQYRDGIRYQNECQVSYVLPNDYNELDRLHQQHWMFTYIMQCHYHAPINDLLKNGIKVLDSGCGPGTWTLEMAEKYSNSKFFGVDSSAVFPENIKPANVEFSVSNIAKQIPFSNDTFDFIYQRLLVLGLTNDDWDNALLELYRVLKPGGYIELIEPDMKNVENIGPLLDQLNSKMINIMMYAKMVPEIAIELKDRLHKVGFTNIMLKKVPMKLNHTDKGGQLFWEDFRQAYSNNRPMMAKTNPDWDSEEVYEQYLIDCGKECKKNKTFGHSYVYVAQKPNN